MTAGLITGFIVGVVIYLFLRVGGANRYFARFTGAVVGMGTVLVFYWIDPELVLGRAGDTN